MRSLLLIAAVLGVLLALNLPSGANIPPTQPEIVTPEVATECSKYLATPTQVRLNQWIATLQSGLMKNPELAQDVWTCIMDLNKMVATDDFVFKACTADADAQFEPVVFKALEGHLDQCGIGIQR